MEEEMLATNIQVPEVSRCLFYSKDVDTTREEPQINSYRAENTLDIFSMKLGSNFNRPRSELDSNEHFKAREESINRLKNQETSFFMNQMYIIDNVSIEKLGVCPVEEFSIFTLIEEEKFEKRDKRQ
ncbi:MAG: hypothetical protein KDD45_08940 [Bdellovibrionales bacterium]|nr:hypothetical protein [Bdellovibrionales bacterium]